MDQLLGLSDVAAILRAADAARVILIGGQAVGFWSERYLEGCPELQAEAPFSSRDVDFQGDRAGVATLAASLGARAYFPRSMEDVTNTGYLEVRLGDLEVGVNVLVSPYGVRRELVEASAVRTRLGDFEFRVMHPVLCMESRLANVAGLGREGPRSLAQARASIVCAREFIRELVDLARCAPRCGCASASTRTRDRTRTRGTRSPSTASTRSPRSRRGPRWPDSSRRGCRRCSASWLRAVAEREAR